MALLRGIAGVSEVRGREIPSPLLFFLAEDFLSKYFNHLVDSSLFYRFSLLLACVLLYIFYILMMCFSSVELLYRTCGWFWTHL